MELYALVALYDKPNDNDIPADLPDLIGHPDEDEDDDDNSESDNELLLRPPIRSLAPAPAPAPAPPARSLRDRGTVHPPGDWWQVKDAAKYRNHPPKCCTPTPTPEPTCTPSSSTSSSPAPVASTSTSAPQPPAYS